MITKLAARQHRDGADRMGFALVITLSLLVLLTILGVGLLSLSSIALRSAAAEQAQHEARANARLGLLIAFGELQKQLGPDQRVTAPAGILDESPDTLEVDGVAHPWWTAVWNTRWSGATGTAENVTPWVRNDREGGLSDRRFPNGFDRRQEVIAYLVSGGEGGRTPPGGGIAIDAVSTNLDAEQAVLLVGPGTLGAAVGGPDSAGRVVVKRVPTSNSARARGAYAFWVGDLGVKANVALVDPYHRDKPERGGNPKGMERMVNAQDTAADAIRDLGLIEPDEAARIFSEQSIAVAKAVRKEVAKAHFHAITQQSSSVLTNVRQGGLQRDLTVYLNNNRGRIPDLTVEGKRIAWGLDDSDKIIGPANAKVAAEQGTRWEQTKYRDIAPSFALLRNWNQIGQQLALATARRKMIPPATTTDSTDLRGMNDGSNVYDGANLLPARFLPHDEPNLSPVIAEASIYYNLATFPDVPNSTTAQSNLRVCLYPRVALWNPYNVELELAPTVAQLFVNGNKDVELNFGGSIARKVVPIPFGRGSTKSGAVLRGVDKSPGHYVGTVLFNLPAVTIAPGETLVFSPDHAGEYQIDNIYNNTLSPGVAPDPSRYYWQNLTMKHAQPPLQFIEKPGAAGQSGGDNYLMALKDASRTRGRPTDNDFDSLPLIVYANTSLQAGGSDELPVQWNSSSPVPVYRLASTTAILPGDAIPDVRTRDGFRFRWWNENIRSNIAGSGQLARAARHFQSAVIANWNPRAAYFCRTPWDNVTDPAPHFYGCYTRDLFDGEVSFSALAPRARNGRMLGHPFGPPLEGPDQLVLFEVPRQETGIPSLGYLRHLKLSEFGWHPSYAIGNSLVDPRTGRTTTSPVLRSSLEKSRNGWNQYLLGWADDRSSGRGPDYWAMLTRQILFNRPDDHFVVYDLSYEANFNLWDNYFLSTGTQARKAAFLTDPLAHPLPNGRMRLYPHGNTLERDLNDFHRTASKLMLDGGFNVHSISKDAWKAVLASTRDTGFGSADAIPFPRLLNPPQGEWLAGNPEASEATGGFRSLSDYELDALAEQIVREVKERAPFFGLADFVNRRLVDTKHGDSGPLQAAIDAAGTNSVFDARYPLDNETELPNVRFDNMSDATRLSQTLKPSSTAWGIPGYLTQGDILQVVGSTLTARSDTFMIRAYGESVDATGKVQARAWCEAMVQRTPEPVTPDAAGLNPAEALDGRTDFGRRFQIVSFRWMNPDEV